MKPFDSLRSLRAGWRARVGLRDRDAELREEIDAHLRMAAQDRIDRGLPAAEAQQAALREFGNVALVTAATRTVWSWTTVEQLLQDLRFGARILRTSPGLSATAILLIALVIGANTTIFSMVHTLITKPAAGIEADRLVVVGFVGRPSFGEMSYAEYRDYVAQTRSLQPLIGFGFERMTLGIDAVSYGVNGTLVPPRYFETLGARLVRGRALSDADHQSDGALPAVVSFRVWRDHYEHAEDIIGRPITVNGYPARITGVAAPGFRGVFLSEAADVWVPIVSYYRARGRESDLERRSGWHVIVIGRLATGVSLAEAEAEFATVARRLETQYPATNKDRVTQLHPYAMTAGTFISDRAGVFLAVFSVITLLTLIIVAANVANLMLARAVTRQRETAVRQSLGASRWRIVRMLLAEGITISAAAWVAACLLAVAVTKLVLATLPPAAAGITIDPGFMPDWQVVTYAMILAAAATMVFTLAPAIRTWRQPVLAPLKAGEQSVAAGRSRASSTLVVVQLAFSVLLLTLAGLAYRSVTLIQGVDLGFEKDGLLLVNVNVGANIGPRTGDKTANIVLLERLQQRFRQVPGVTAASYVRNPPRRAPADYTVRLNATEEPRRVRRHAVGADYFQTIGVPLRAGREFASQDRITTPLVAVVNQHLADALWPDGRAIGSTILLGESSEPAEVVGVSPNVLLEGYRAEPRHFDVIVADAQVPATVSLPTFYIRHTGRVDSIAPGIASAVRDVDPGIAIFWERTMAEQLEQVGEDFAMVATLLLVFAGGSLVIAAIGQYAVVAFDMRRRTREFGVRLALGASDTQVLGGVLREGLVLTFSGLLFGFALSAAAAGALRNFFYGITATDPPTYFGVFAILACASLAACYLPARRAASIDPVDALRQE